MNTCTATLKPGRDKPVRLGHPWIFSGAIAAWSSAPTPGAVVDVIASGGDWLARGLASPNGNLAIRLYTREPDTRLDTALLVGRLEQAFAARERDVVPQEPDTDSFRLCYSEADGLSGLIVDRYRDRAVYTINTALLRPHLPALLEVATSRGWTPVVLEDAEDLAKEGAVARASAGDSSAAIAIKESGFVYTVDVLGGQKTGFFLDQRVNRRRVAAYASGRRCLDAYCYTGGFTVHLAHGGAAAVTGLDRSEPALARARENLALNPAASPVTFSVADVPEKLRAFSDRRERFDLIVLDPPKFVHHQGQLDKGLRAYKDINRLAMKLLTPGGVLATFSCSGWVKRDTLLTALRWAAQDAGREARILETLGQPPDHPVALAFPESDYLCGYILSVG